MTTAIRVFTESDVDAAARLLADRHTTHRKSAPLLDTRFEEPNEAAAEIAAVLATDGTSGAVAEVDGMVTGYLLGSPKPNVTWGPNVWVEAAGIAVEDAEVARDLYGFASARWYEQGATAHYVVLPSHDTALVDAWSRLAFGQQHAHAIRLPKKIDVTPRSGVTIRRPTRADIPALAALELALPQHQGLAPVFSAGSVPTLEESIDEWEDDFDDPDFSTYVAEVDGEVVGSAIGCPITKSGTHKGLASAPNAGFLGFASVFPEARGRGIGRALGDTVISWCAEAGFDSVITDWRVTNLLSSRAWPRLGFEQTFIRMHRNLGY